MSSSPKEPDQPTSKDEGGNILVIRLKSLGDVLFTLPAVRHLRASRPGARISFLVSRENAELIEGFRDVDQTLVLDRAAYRRGNPLAILRQTWSLLSRFRRERFTLAVDFQGYGETALLTWCTRAPQRWGTVYQPTRAWAYTRPVVLRRGLHPADWNLALLHEGGLAPGEIRNDFVLPETPLAEARRFLAAQQLDPARPLMFIQPFTSTPKKNWPLANLVALAGHWKSRGVQVLFGGGPGEQEALAPVREAGYPVSAGVPLLVTAGLMKLSTVVVGGDTGMPHLAMAMGKRVVMIMASARKGTTHPYRHADWAVVPPVDDRIITHIPTDSVIQACAAAFREVDARVRV